MSERQFRRYRYEELGEAGWSTVVLACFRRVGFRGSDRGDAGALPASLTGWNVKHFHEHLLRDYHFSSRYTFIKTQLHAAGLVDRHALRSHRRKREQSPCSGMTLHQDGSPHA